MASAEASATVMKKSWTPKSTSDKASQILAAVNRHGDKESPVIVFLPGWQERWQVEKALKKKRVSVNVIGNERKQGNAQFEREREATQIYQAKRCSGMNPVFLGTGQLKSRAMILAPEPNMTLNSMVF